MPVGESPEDAQAPNIRARETTKKARLKKRNAVIVFTFALKEAFYGRSLIRQAKGMQNQNVGEPILLLAMNISLKSSTNQPFTFYTKRK